MLSAINFPNLGLNFESVGYGISIFGIEISYYGILFGVAFLVGVGMILLEAGYTGQHVENYLELVLVATPVSIIGARIFYVLFSWAAYKNSLAHIVFCWEGGYAFYGGFFAAFVMILIFAKMRQMWTAEVLDTLTIGLVIGQAIASFGSFFNREGFGEYTEGIFAMQLPIEILRISDVTDKMRNHMTVVDGVRFVQVTPLFFYRVVICLLLFIGLYLYRKNKDFDGEIFLIYLVVDSASRFWMEGIRTDALYLPVLHWPVSKVLAGIIFVAAIVAIIYNQKMDGQGKMRRIRQKNAVLGVNEFENLFHNK